MVAVLKFRARPAIWALLSFALGTGCVDVPLRPDGSPAEEKCPKGAREAMEALRLRPGLAVTVEVDARQQSRDKQLPLVIYDGPIESETWDPMADLPAGTRLHGRVWTGGPRVIIRYYSARLPDGKVIPFCGVAAESGPGLPKGPGRPGSAALKDSTGWVYVTGQFR